MSEAHRGRPQHGAKLIKRAGKSSWYVQFYDEETGQTRRISTGTADRQAAERFLASWLKPSNVVIFDPRPTTEASHAFLAHPRSPVPEKEAFNREFLKRVRSLRLRANLSYSQIALAMGVPEKRYIHWEKHSPMPAYAIAAFATIVGAHLHFVLTGEVEKNE